MREDTPTLWKMTGKSKPGQCRDPEQNRSFCSPSAPLYLFPSHTSCTHPTFALKEEEGPCAQQIPQRNTYTGGSDDRVRTQQTSASLTQLS